MTDLSRSGTGSELLESAASGMKLPLTQWWYEAVPCTPIQAPNSVSIGS
jgi:hypothetical protein